MNESLQQSIIYAMQLFPKSGRRLQQEAAQSLWVREAGQAREVLESAVGTQE